MPMLELGEDGFYLSGRRVLDSEHVQRRDGDRWVDDHIIVFEIPEHGRVAMFTTLRRTGNPLERPQALDATRCELRWPPSS